MVDRAGGSDQRQIRKYGRISRRRRRRALCRSHDLAPDGGGGAEKNGYSNDRVGAAERVQQKDQRETAAGGAHKIEEVDAVDGHQALEVIFCAAAGQETAAERLGYCDFALVHKDFDMRVAEN